MSRADARSEEAQAYRRWYKRATWARLRLWRLNIEPLCRMCADEGETTPADTVDHVEPHKGDWSLFIDPDNTQSLCARCHSERKQRQEIHGYDDALGADGWPIDPAHPANRG
jgi:5-methylcytosine-specific restriction endonuclease McrA